MNEEKALRAAARAIQEADKILICAGAGMSVEQGLATYVNPDDFKTFYPGMLQYGYRTAYQTMGLFDDPSLDQKVKWGFQAAHINNQRYRFNHHQGYSDLLSICQDKISDSKDSNDLNALDYFVWTSNVDGYFERAGFAVEQIYTPQGDWKYLQCRSTTCRDQPVFDSRPIIELALEHLDVETSMITEPGAIPACPNCGKLTVFGNVRGGAWFKHDHFNEQQDRLIAWLENIKEKDQTLAIIEIGAGFNTPTVTRFPMEDITREFDNATLIRINPSDPSVPSDLTDIGKGISLATGWQVISDIKELLGSEKKETKQEGNCENVMSGTADTNSLARDHSDMQFPWRQCLKQLRG